jgi:rod shape-determining protein MreD
MSIELLKKLGAFALFCLMQVLVLNRIHLFGVATPLLCVYFVMRFRRNYPKWGLLLWAFFMGLTIDSFSNTPGVTAASLTFVAALQPYLFTPFVARDSADDVEPAMYQIGFTKYLSYALIMVFVFCLLFFTLEMFSFFNWLYWLECVVGSTVLVTLLIVVMESVRRA